MASSAFVASSRQAKKGPSAQLIFGYLRRRLRPLEGRRRAGDVAVDWAVGIQTGMESAIYNAEAERLDAEDGQAIGLHLEARSIFMASAECPS